MTTPSARRQQGVVYSEPGCPAQHWHSDSLHLSPHSTSANLVNGLIALHAVPLSMGPTEFVPGSQQDTNHLCYETIPATVVYQHEANAPDLLGIDRPTFTMELPAGTVVLFDDRTYCSLPSR